MTPEQLQEIANTTLNILSEKYPTLVVGLMLYDNTTGYARVSANIKEGMKFFKDMQRHLDEDET